MFPQFQIQQAKNSASRVKVCAGETRLGERWRPRFVGSRSRVASLYHSGSTWHQVQSRLAKMSSGVVAEAAAKGMTPVDYVVLVGLLCGSLGIGVYYALCRKQTSTADYLVGGRSMPLVPTAISLLASYISAILILGQFSHNLFCFSAPLGKYITIQKNRVEFFNLRPAYCEKSA